MDNLKIEKIDQIGIVVHDCEATAKFLENVIGIGPFQIFDRRPDDFFYKGKVNKIHIKNALCRLNNIQIELIEIVNALDGSCTQKDWLDEKGPSIHHFGIYVNDLDSALEELNKNGIKLLQKGNTTGPVFFQECNGAFR